MHRAKLMQSAAKFTHQSQILFAVPGSIWKTHEQYSLINTKLHLLGIDEKRFVERSP